MQNWVAFLGTNLIFRGTYSLGQSYLDENSEEEFLSLLTCPHFQDFWSIVLLCLYFFCYLIPNKVMSNSSSDPSGWVGKDRISSIFPFCLSIG